MIEKIINEVNNAKKIIILAHIGEDPDAAASSFALCHALKNMNKDVNCVFSEPVLRCLGFLEEDYIVYESGMDISCDLCICLDCGELTRLGDRIGIFEQAEKTINIDHHYTNTKFAMINWVDEKASATGEMLYWLIDKIGKLSKYTATALYAAIASDTGCFKYSNVTPQTLRITANLLEYDINHGDITRIIFDTEELSVMQLKASVIESIRSYYDGKLAVISVDSSVYKKYQVDESNAGELVTIPRKIAGVEVAVSIKRKMDKSKISLRSNGLINVAEIAEHLGGGGHKMAAGAVVDKSIEEVEKQIVELVGRIVAN